MTNYEEDKIHMCKKAKPETRKEPGPLVASLRHPISPRCLLQDLVTGDDRNLPVVRLVLLAAERMAAGSTPLPLDF